MNEVRLIGRLGDAPKSFSENGTTKVAGCSLATNKVYTDKSGNKVEQTEWHQLVFFGYNAENAQKYLEKGDKVHVSGEITYKKYVGKDGIERINTQIVVNGFEFFKSK